MILRTKNLSLSSIFKPLILRVASLLASIKLQIFNRYQNYSFKLAWVFIFSVTNRDKLLEKNGTMCHASKRIVPQSGSISFFCFTLGSNNSFTGLSPSDEPLFARKSAVSLPCMPTWAFTHLR